MHKLSLACLILLLISSCTSEMREKLEPRATAFGPLNQLVVVADENVWEGAVGDTFDYYFASAYPVLPQPEPIYDLRYFDPIQLIQKKERRELRNYVVIADLNDLDSEATKLIYRDIKPELIEEAKSSNTYKTAVRQDRWADNQLVVYMFGFGHDQLIENIQTNFQGVNRRVRKSEAVEIDAKVYPGGTNGSLVKEVKEKSGVDIKIPSDYFLAMHDDLDNTIWLRRETPEVSMNIMFRKMTYADAAQLEPEYIQSLVDSLGKYVSSDMDNTFLQVNDIDLPVIAEVFDREDRYTSQIRGIWEIENDFMGGPFVAEMSLQPSTNELLLSFGFIFAPGEDKRDLMKFMEHVMASAKF